MENESSTGTIKNQPFIKLYSAVMCSENGSVMRLKIRLNAFHITSYHEGLDVDVDGEHYKTTVIYCAGKEYAITQPLDAIDRLMANIESGLMVDFQQNNNQL